MSADILIQITTATLTILSGVISSFLTYYFNQKFERKKRKFNRIKKLKSWVSSMSIVGFMQSVEYYETRSMMNHSEKISLDNQIKTITLKYDVLHSELENNFNKWKETWDITLTSGIPSKIEPLAYYSTLKEQMHKNYLLGTQENLAMLKETMMTTLCRNEKKL